MKTIHELLYVLYVRIRSLFWKPLDQRMRSSDIWARLEKYREDIRTRPELRTPAPNAEPVKIIWQFWWQSATNPPPVVARCFESVRRHCGDYRVIVLDQNNFEQYVEMPEYVRNYFRGHEHSAHFSDYIRFSLLTKYGGVWLDATVFLTDRIPDEILQCEYFQPCAGFWAQPCHHVTESVVRALDEQAFPHNTYLIGDTGILVARPGSRMALAVKILLDEYWKREGVLITYLFIQYLMTLAIIYNENCRAEFDNMYRWEFSYPRAIRPWLGKAFDPQVWDELKRFSPAHRISYKWSHQTPLQDESGRPTLYAAILEGEAI